MKLINSSLGMAFILPVILFAQAKTNIRIQNNSASDRKETVVALKWETIVSRYPQIDTTGFVVINASLFSCIYAKTISILLKPSSLLLNKDVEQ